MSLQNLLNNPHKFKAYVKEYREDESPICVICGHGESLHICEVCEKEIPSVLYKTMRMCASCYQTELAAQKELEATADARVDKMNADRLQRIAAEAKKLLDETIEIRSDYFNADIPSLISLKDSIYSDESVSADDKQFAYTSLLKNHIGHMRQTLIDMRDAEQKIGARMKLMQSEIQREANLLREEERKILQIESINYTPVAPKTDKTPKAPTTRTVGKNKVDAKEIQAAAKEHNIPEQVLMMLVKFKGYTVGRAVAEYRSAESSVKS